MMEYFPGFTKKQTELVRKEFQRGNIKNAIQRFSFLMKNELEKHLGRPGWKRESVDFLIMRLYEETKELVEALEKNSTKENIEKECADIANFAMMIADVYRQKSEANNER